MPQRYVLTNPLKDHDRRVESQVIEFVLDQHMDSSTIPYLTRYRWNAAGDKLLRGKLTGRIWPSTVGRKGYQWSGYGWLEGKVVNVYRVHIMRNWPCGRNEKVNRKSSLRNRSEDVKR